MLQFLLANEFITHLAIMEEATKNLMTKLLTNCKHVPISLGSLEVHHRLKRFNTIIEIHHTSSIESLIDPTICFDDSKITTYVGIEYEANLGDCEIPGCTDELMYNFNSVASYDDNSCFYPSESTIDYILDLHSGANLISFHALPEDNSVASILTNSCIDETSMGSAFISTLVKENDTLEMLLPDSPLTGYWVQ